MPLDARTMSSRRVSWPAQQLDSPRVRHEVGNSDLRQAVCPFIGPPHLLAPKFTSVPASFAEQNSAKTGGQRQLRAVRGCELSGESHWHLRTSDASTMIC